MTCGLRIARCTLLPASAPFPARLVGQKTPHSGSGIVRRDSHVDQSLNYLGRGNTTIEIVLDHMNARKPNFRIYPRRRRLRVATYATNVTIDASVSVSRGRPHQHARGNEQNGNGHSSRRSSSLTAAEIGDLHRNLLPKRHVTASRTVASRYSLSNGPTSDCLSTKLSSAQTTRTRLRPQTMRCFRR